MIEWPLLVVTGLLGSSHCLGMCGGFALAVGGGARTVWESLLRQILFTAGRVFTYAVLGAAAGFAGARLAAAVPQLVSVTAVLAIIAGVMMILQGLAATGIWHTRSVGKSGIVCLVSSIYRPFLAGRSGGVFLAGLFTGLLPCGLLYSILALAGSTGDLVQGMGTMIAFGLGTAPALILAGSGGSLLSLRLRKRVFAIAAWCLILAGGLSMARGASFLRSAPPGGIGSCPCCTPAAAD